MKLLDLSNERWPPSCRLCERKILAEAYTCKEGCSSYSYYHRACVEAPPRIDHHPLHLDHPLTLSHGRLKLKCHACGERFYYGYSSFRGHECHFNLDIGCALSTLSDIGSYQGGKTSEQITLPLHPHTLTSFSTRHDFVGNSNCEICQGSVEGDGFMCLRSPCKFIIHKRCIQDLYYADGTKAPRVYHGHPLATFVGEDTCSTRCASCASDKPGEFIGCACCEVFYHRHCFQVPEILRYPSHYMDHTLVLFPNIGTRRRCQSCSGSLKDEIYYSCTSCEFLVHIGCAIRTIGYYADGMSKYADVSWHKHLMILCHRVKPFFNSCPCCEDEIDGPAYVCREEDCELVLHEQCANLMPEMEHHPHHPEHPLVLLMEESEGIYQCAACCSKIKGFSFSCGLCHCNFHVKCMARFPTRKHYLHEHELLHFDKISSAECNRCRTADNSPIFRCVPCNFNLHEKCMELPRVVKHKAHFHPLTLREFFRYDDEMDKVLCDLCNKWADERLGVYICGLCELTVDRPWAFHIECILPELQKVYVWKGNTIARESLADKITRRKKEVRVAVRKLDQVKSELEEVRKKHASMALE